jgi:hypothetical protein
VLSGILAWSAVLRLTRSERRVARVRERQSPFRATGGAAFGVDSKRGRPLDSAREALATARSDANENVAESGSTDEFRNAPPSYTFRRDLDRR